MKVGIKKFLSMILMMAMILSGTSTIAFAEDGDEDAGIVAAADNGDEDEGEDNEEDEENNEEDEEDEEETVENKEDADEEEAENDDEADEADDEEEAELMLTASADESEEEEETEEDEEAEKAAEMAEANKAGDYELNYTSEEAREAGFTSFSVNDEGTITIYAYNADIGGKEVKIPSSIDGIEVTIIEEEAFGREHTTTNMKITSVEMPDTITYLGFANFYYCTGLESIRLSENLEFIGYNNFYSCKNLTELYIPASVTEIEATAFGASGIEAFTVSEDNKVYASYEGAIYSKDYTILYFYPVPATDLVLHDDTVEIYEDAFYTCKYLTEIDLSDTKVTILGDTAFDSCSGLVTVKLPALTSLGLNVFSGCSKITTLEMATSEKYKLGEDGFTIYSADGEELIMCIPSASGTITVENGTKTLSDLAFYNCSKVTKIVLPNGLENIGTEDTLAKGTFSGCSALTEINIPEGVTSLYRNTFYSCNSLTTITIPASMTYIHPRALMNYGIQTISVAEGNEYFAVEDGILYTSDMKELIKYPSGRADTSYTVKDGVEVIGEAAFYRAKSLTEVTLPDSVTELGPYAFYLDTNITTINLSSNLSIIGEYCFNQCTVLTNGMTFSATVTEIGEHAFYYCTSLTNIEVDDDNEVFASYDGALYDKELTTLIRCPEGKTELEIAPTTTAIGERAFWHCTILTSIVVPEGVVSLGKQAFYQCKKLADVTLPTTLKSVGANCFINCDDDLLFFYVVEDSTAHAYVEWADYNYAFIDTYEISFDAGKGSCDTESMTTNSAYKLSSLPDATRKNYTFDGWYTESSGGEQITEDTVFTEDMVVYAHWTASSSSSNKSSGSSHSLTNTTGSSSSSSTQISTTVDSTTPVIGETTEDTPVIGETTSETTATNVFTDVSADDEYYDAIMTVYANGWMAGVGDNKFDSEGTLTRAMAARIIWNMMGQPSSESVAPFLDVTSDTWYAEPVAWAYEQGIIYGYDDTSFGPDDYLTEEQFEMILSRIAGEETQAYTGESSNATRGWVASMIVG
ncbi:MAG: leucine-rich repeat protein [Clostridiales bacterium]|nr:leucine-rich repeat protein [Clostridiales bacterium]